MDKHYFCKDGSKVFLNQLLEYQRDGQEGCICKDGIAPRDQLYKIGLSGKSILGDYFQENRTSQRPFLLLRISFPGKTYFYTIASRCSNTGDLVQCPDGSHIDLSFGKPGNFLDGCKEDKWEFT